MKIQLMKVLAKLSLLSVIGLVTAVASAQGQSLQYRIRANVPFDFSVGDKKLPSGRYSIGRAGSNSDDTILSIIDADGRSKAIPSSISVQTWRIKDQATLVFHRYGDQYFLFQVWPAGGTTGRQFVKSRSEREIQHTLAANPSNRKMTTDMEVETVTIVLQ